MRKISFLKRNFFELPMFEILSDKVSLTVCLYLNANAELITTSTTAISFASLSSHDTSLKELPKYD